MGLSAIIAQLCIVSWCVTTMLYDPVFASKQKCFCDFPAIFNFGDSNSDTGGLAAGFPTALSPPYGETFFGEPAGRFSDGRLIIDFIAKSLGLPFLSPYLDSLGNKFVKGANFATAGSTIRLLYTNIIPSGQFSPFFLDAQFTQFVRLKFTSQKAKKRGRSGYAITPKDKDFKKALYTFDIGQNDLNAVFLETLSLDKVIESVPDIVQNFARNFQDIYNISGGKTFWIHNTGPIGCLPVILSLLPSTIEKDEAGCAKPFNEVAQYFNSVLKQATLNLSNQFPSAAITYVDVYSVKYSLFAHPHKYGFDHPFVTCCGYGGGEYNYDNNVTCGGTTTANGTKICVGSCQQPSNRVIWDGVHYTEAANRFVFDRIVTGDFSDPPRSLRKSCFTSTI
ncbi:GDSL esterase/lipase ENOD8-like [Humulus lupulus]|uniref:GDSL esterase/lipase ENOD8-like n=1 Tax=Humulus lupulus TaxID=3486 RepID=UPI002B4124EF|nr:GDSL esterase/lipase ENOD8-like [Humulus lupulus]